MQHLGKVKDLLVKIMSDFEFQSSYARSVATIVAH